MATIVSVKSDGCHVNTRQPCVFSVIASFPYPVGYRTRSMNKVYLLSEKAATTLKKKLG